MEDNKKEKKNSKIKGFDPKKYVNTEPELKEATKSKVAVVSFGRMNPITIGHEKLVNKVMQVASKEKGIPAIFLSHTYDPKRNPLSYQEKLRYAQRAFGNVVKKSKAKTIIQVAIELQSKFSNLILVAGSDRLKEFETLLNKYNGKDYTYDSIKVVSAGERDPDAEGVAGMSASKLRSLAVDNNLPEFKKGLPRKLRVSAEEIMNTIRNGMGITEEIVYEALTNVQRKKRALLMRRLAPKIKRGRERAARKVATTDKLKGRARKQAINIMKDKFAKGKSYGELSYSQRQTIDDRIKKMPANKLNTLSKKLLPSVKSKEKERFANRNKKEDINTSFENFLNERETACLPKMMKRPHMLLTKDNKVKCDKRFKMYRQANTSSDGELPTQKINESMISEAVDLMESVESYMAEAPFGGNTSFFKKVLPGVEKWLDKNIRSKTYQNAIKQYAEFKNKGVKDALVRAAKIWNVDARTLDDYYNDMIGESVNMDKLEGFKKYIELDESVKQKYTVYDKKKKIIVEPNLTRAAAIKMAAAKGLEYGSSEWVHDMMNESLDEKFAKNAKQAEKEFQKSFGSTMNAKEELVKEGIDYADRAKRVNQEYEVLKKKSIKDLRRMISQIHRVVDLKGYDKQGAISDILRSKYGNKAVDLAMNENLQEKDKDDPCWKGYEKFGTKKKNGKEVPNCIPKKEDTVKESGAGEEGTDELRKKYQKDTPGQEVTTVNKIIKTFLQNSKSLGESLPYGDKETYNLKNKERNAGLEKEKNTNVTYSLKVDEKILKDKYGNPMTWKQKDAAVKAAQTMMKKPFNKGKEFMLVKRTK